MTTLTTLHLTLYQKVKMEATPAVLLQMSSWRVGEGKCYCTLIFSFPCNAAINCNSTRMLISFVSMKEDVCSCLCMFLFSWKYKFLSYSAGKFMSFLIDSGSVLMMCIIYYLWLLKPTVFCSFWGVCAPMSFLLHILNCVLCIFNTGWNI